MYFRKLPEHVKKGIYYINNDAIFRERFRHDPVLDALDEEKLDIDVCNAHLKQIFRRRVRDQRREAEADDPCGLELALEHVVSLCQDER